MTAQHTKVLVTDFDGTITQRDFYACVVEQLLSPDDLAPWHAYTRGELSHFEALRRIFAKIRADESRLDDVLQSMRIAPDLKAGVERLRQSGWEVLVVSNGCCWYIDKLLRRAGVELTVHSNPGNFHPTSGLQLVAPTGSPFYSAEYGISKSAVVRDALRRAEHVAFAGDGRPDVEPALLVPPPLRFACGWLAEELARRNVPFQKFDVWSEIPMALVSEAD